MTPNENDEKYLTSLEEMKKQSDEIYNSMDYYDTMGYSNYSDIDTPKELENDWSDFGNSSHDIASINPERKTGELNEMRAADQSFGEKIALGAAKMATTAATTFLDNTVGFVWGVGSAIKNGDLTRLYDNDFTNAIQDFNEWCEEKMPHYSSQYEGWGLDFWGNFIGKDILQNAGFQIGTGLSMILPTGIGVGAAKTGLSLTKSLAKFTSMSAKTARGTSQALKDFIVGTYSAIGESSIEALQNKRDFVKYQNQLNDDNFRQQNQQLDTEWAKYVLNKYEGDEKQAAGDPLYLEYINKKNALKQQKAQKEQFIKQESDKVGDMTFMANMAIVGTSNFITFGKAVGGGMNLFKRLNAPTVTDIVSKEGEVLAKNVGKKAAKEVEKTGKYLIKNKEGEKVLVDALTTERGKTKSAAWNTIKDALSEGLEEMNQQVASEYSTNLATNDMLNYDALAKDGMAYDDIVKQMNSSWMNFGELAKAFKKVYTDPSQYRQFFGGMIGVGFSPHFQRGTDGELHFKLNNIGAQNADIAARNSTNAAIAEDINRILHSEESQNYIQGLVRHKALDNSKEGSATLDSKMDYQDSDFAQYISDIATLSRNNKLDLLKAQLISAKSMSDEELEDYCVKLCTDKNGKKVGEFVDNNGNFIGTDEKSRLEVRKKINNRVDNLIKDMVTYQKALKDIDGKTSGVLSDNDLATFAWEQANIANKFGRAKSILGSEKSAKNLAKAKETLSNRITTLTSQLETTQKNLKDEKERISHANSLIDIAKGQKKLDASELQKSLENDINKLTTNINLATEASKLIADLELMQTDSNNSDDEIDEVKKLFEKYSDFKKSMPETAKFLGLDKDKTTSLERVMSTGFLNNLFSLMSENAIGENALDNDYIDSAKLYRRGVDTERHFEEVVAHPDDYATHRAELERKVIENQNGDTIKAIEAEISKMLDDGIANYSNLEEKSKEALEKVKKEKEENKAGMKLFNRAVERLNDTPFDTLRKIALNNILGSKKYKHIKELIGFINYVNIRIVENQSSSLQTKQVAQRTFNELIKDKKDVKECLRTEFDKDDFDVTDLYKDNYTEETFANAQLVQNEAYQLLKKIYQDFALDYYAPRLLTRKYSLGAEKATIQQAEAQDATIKEMEEKRPELEKKLTDYISKFKEGEFLTEEDQEELYNHISEEVDKAFNSSEYSDFLKNVIDGINAECKMNMLNILENICKQRITGFYREKRSEKKEEGEKSNVEKLEDTKKEIDKILEKISKAKDINIFSKQFDSVAIENPISVETDDSLEGYYVEDGNVHRANIIPCKVTFKGHKKQENCFAVIEDYAGTTRYIILSEDGAVRGEKYVYEEIDKNSKQELVFENIEEQFRNTSLKDIVAQKFLEKVNEVTSPSENRLEEAREEAAVEILEDNETIDENGKVNANENLPKSVVAVNAVMDSNITQKKSDIEMISNTVSQQRNGIQYFLILKDDEFIFVKVPSNGNRIYSKTQNGKEKEQKFSKAIYKKEGIEGVLRNIFGDEIEIANSSLEEYSPKVEEKKEEKKETPKVEEKQTEEKEERKKKEEEKVEEKQKEEKVEEEATAKTSEQKAEEANNETKPTLAETKKEEKKVAKAKARKTAKKLDEQIKELEEMEKTLEQAAKENPECYDTLHTVSTFKAYVRLVKENYTQLGSPKNVVLDSKTIDSLVSNLKSNLKSIFGDDVKFLSSKEIDEELEKYNNNKNEKGKLNYEKAPPRVRRFGAHDSRRLRRRHLHHPADRRQLHCRDGQVVR